MELKKAIETSLEKSISGKAYEALLERFAAEGKTSGTQNEDLIYYTKLNAQRSRRIYKTTDLEAELAEVVQSLPTQTWLLLTETWCGDAANSVPIIARLAELNEKIDLRIVFRDENPELMDLFLTKGGRSIPKLIGLDANKKVLFDWGPRPAEAQKLYWDWREEDQRIPYSEFHIVMQKWYTQNQGLAIQQELKEKVEKAS
ncbi:MAG: thioredoxin family protein [Bacteroidota bacterium]